MSGIKKLIKREIIMKIAVIGSREIDNIDLKKHLPEECDEIVSGGARGVDTLAANYAKENGLALTEFLPNYEAFGRSAPLIRNRGIVDYADGVIAFWDGTSRGTAYVRLLPKSYNRYKRKRGHRSEPKS